MLLIKDEDIVFGIQRTKDVAAAEVIRNLRTEVIQANRIQGHKETVTTKERNQDVSDAMAEEVAADIADQVAPATDTVQEVNLHI